jgi:fibronectin-binding autotransporter adhesin
MIMKKILLVTLTTLGIPALGMAASLTLTNNDALNGSSFNTKGFWNDSVAPTAGNDYFTSQQFRLRSPASGSSFTFAGDSLTINGTNGYNTGFMFKGTGGAGVLTINNLILDGGWIHHQNGSGDTCRIAGGMTVLSPSRIDTKQGPIVIDATVSGSGTITNASGDNHANNYTITYTANNSAFTGRMVIMNANNRVQITNENNLGGNPLSFTADQLQVDAGWLQTGISNHVVLDDSNRGITLNGSWSINPQQGSTLTIACPIAGAGELNKRGPGILVLSGDNSAHFGGVRLGAFSAGSQLNVNSAAALGSGVFTINNDGNQPTLDNTSGSALTLTTGNGAAWNRSFTFLGSSSLNMGSGAVTLGANLAVTVSNNNLTVGSVGGGFALTKQGPGTLTIDGGGAYSGNTIISEGTLALLNTGSLSSPTITVASNATLDVSGPGLTLVFGQTLAGSGTVAGNVADGAGATVISPGTSAGTLTINGNLDLNGGGTLNFELVPAPTVGGGTNDLIIVTGQLNFGNASGTTALNILGTTGSGVTYTLFQYNTFIGSLANVTVPPGYTLNNNTTAKTIELISSHIPVALTWVGDGSLNTWDIGGALNWSSGGPTAFYNSDTVTFDDSGDNTVAVNLTTAVAPAAVIVSASQDYTFTGAGIASGSLAKSGAGTLVLDNLNTYSGATVINAGTLQLGDSAGLAGGTTFGAAGSIGTGPVTNNGNLVFSRAADMIITQPIEGSGAISNVGSSGVVTLAGSVSGSSVTMAGFGALALNASNSYSGATLISSGTLLARNNNALGTTTAGTTVEGGATLYFDNGQPLSVEAEALTLNNGTLRRGGAQVLWWGTPVSLLTLGTLSVDGGATLNLTNTAGVSGTDVGLTLTGAGVGNLSGPISLGTAALTVGGGTWNVAAVNNYSGKTFLNGGTLFIPALTALGTVSGVTPDFVSLSGGSLGVTNDLSFTDGQRGFTVNGAAGGFNVGSGATLTVANDISGFGVLTKSGAGTLLLNAAHTFAGTFNLDTAATSGSDGVVRLTTGAALANVVAPIWVRNNNGGSSTLELDGSSGGISIAQIFRVNCRNNDVAWVRSLAGNNTLAGGVEFEVGGNRSVLQADAGLLTISGDLNYVGTLTGGRTYTFTGAGNILVSGVINNSANGAPIGVTKNGPGKLTLSAANTYGNTTTVNGGVLELTGSITSTNGVVVNGGALAGSGTITDNVTVTASIPSETIGSLTVNGNYTINGYLSVDVNRSGLASDLATVSGTLANTGTGAIFVNNLGAALQVGDTFTLFNQAITGGATMGVSGGGVTWTNNGGNGTITVVATTVPQPAITGVTPAGSNLTLSGSGGPAFGAFQVVSSTDVSVPLANWTVEATSVFDGTGNFSVSVPIQTGVPQKFYAVVVPN